MSATFFIPAAIAVIATLLVITRKNAVQALLYLALSLLSIAIVFYELGAPFIAALEVIIYAGSIIVLFIFVVMMLNLGKAATLAEQKILNRRMWIGPSVIAAIMLGEIVSLLVRDQTGAAAAQVIPPQAVGAVLYGPYLIGVELASLLLMAALVGAYHLGWHAPAKPEVRDDGREHATSVDPGGDPVRAGSHRPAGAA